MNRGMIICEDMRCVNDVLKSLASASAGIEVLRVKDRYTTPSPGGWRDALVNFVCRGDESRHVCEMQIVHRSMLVARVGLDGHGVYDRVRNAVELLEKLGMLGTKVDEGGAAWNMDFGASPGKKLRKKPTLSSSKAGK